jgi:SAM-dependent methyltransferase
VSESVLDRVRCLRCSAPLDVRPPTVACGACGEAYPRVGAIPVLLPRAREHVELWRRQLALLLASGESTRAGLEAEAARAELPAGAARLSAMARAARAQVDDFAALLGPALGGPLDGPASGLPRGVVEYSYYLFRDWAWTGPDAGENEQAFEALRAAAPGPLGRVLVVGAGGCRLATDLHRRGGASETAVVDIDPYLFVPAEAVVRGRPVRLTEASLNVVDAGRASEAWTLRAPEGPLDDGRFHFFLANGLAPPFAGGTFDTVVTPWFIDRVPPDLSEFLATVRRLLRPGGRWLNQGPLLYPPETPVARRYARDEIVALAARAGLEVEAVDAASRPYLFSPLTGAGKLERVLTFSAVRSPD